jgi:predicted porin
MNKKLIAVAVAGACVAPAAMAQTANPVTLYGRVYVTFESVEAKGQVGSTSDVVRRNRVSDQSSLLGVRGTEDLGGGLKAFFQLETAFKPDQNDTVFAARNSGVGLQGGWGSILLGRWDTPFKTATIAVDPYGDLTLGGITAAMNGSGIANAQATFDRRDQNVVQYWSPTIAGFHARLSYSANEAKTSTVNPRSEGASITWTGGPFYAGYAYHQLKDQPAATFAVTATTPPPFNIGSVTSPKQQGHAVFATATFGPIKIGGLYEKFKRDVIATATTAGTITGFSDQRAYMANIVWTFGNHQLIYQYSRATDGGESIIESATIHRPEEPDCKVHAPGYQYNFTRRTFFLAQYVKVDNNATSSCNFGANTLTIVPGQDPKGFGVGLRHVF